MYIAVFLRRHFSFHHYWLTTLPFSFFKLDRRHQFSVRTARLPPGGPGPECHPWSLWIRSAKAGLRSTAG